MPLLKWSTACVKEAICPQLRMGTQRRRDHHASAEDEVPDPSSESLSVTLRCGRALLYDRDHDLPSHYLPPESRDLSSASEQSADVLAVARIDIHGRYLLACPWSRPIAFITSCVEITNGCFADAFWLWLKPGLYMDEV
jgi:hypothetical protein